MMIAFLVSCSACAIAFGPGTRQASAPQKFQDVDNAKQREEKEMGVRPPAITPGMSIVVGGDRVDAGSLPPPPVPVAKPL